MYNVKKEEVSINIYVSNRRSISSINEEEEKTQNNAENAEGGLDIEEEVEDSNANVNKDKNQHVVQVELNNNDYGDNENYGFINDDEKDVELVKVEESDDSVYEPLHADLVPSMEKLNEISVDQL